MKARFIGENVDTRDVLTEPGDIALAAANYHGGLMVKCPVCHDLHVINFTDMARLCWSWDRSSLTLSPSFKATMPPLVAGNPNDVCHWNLTNGEFVIHGDSTAFPTGAQEGAMQPNATTPDPDRPGACMCSEEHHRGHIACFVLDHEHA
jgi:hypothetical protein